MNSLRNKIRVGGVEVNERKKQTRDSKADRREIKKERKVSESFMYFVLLFVFLSRFILLLFLFLFSIIPGSLFH